MFETLNARLILIIYTNRLNFNFFFKISESFEKKFEQIC